MKEINYIVHTIMDKDEIIDKIRDAKHYSNALMSSRMFIKVTEDKEGYLYLKPDFGVVNLMLIIWSYAISFKDLPKGYLQVKVRRRFNYFAIGFFSFMYIGAFTVISIFLKDKNIGSMKNIIFFMFSTFIILSFILNYFSVKFSMKKIINLLTVLVNGEIEYLK